MVEPKERSFDIVDVMVFLAELALLAALAVAGAHLASGAAAVALAVLLPTVTAVLWGSRLAPRARTRLRYPWRLMVKLVLFGGASVLLATSVTIIWGAILFVTGAALVTIGELRDTVRET